MCVRSAKLLRAVNSERVVPNHPVAQVESHTLGEALHFCNVFVANGQPQSARRLEASMNCLEPIARPGKICLTIQVIAIDVVGITNIVGWISERQIYTLCVDP